MADALDTGSRNVWHWQHRGIPARQAIKIERLSRGKFKLKELCPAAFEGIALRRKRR